MFIAGNFLSALAGVLNWVLWAYMWIIIIRALLSWVNPDPWNPIVQFLNRVTEPVLAPLRRRLPTWQWGIDFSPLVAILAIYFIQRFVVGSIMDLAWRIR
ncbi:MAG: YggT family protein [candidate division NC10 bacterium]|nr:YggT family protein [candidate division NC10 bacterium]